MKTVKIKLLRAVILDRIRVEAGKVVEQPMFIAGPLLACGKAVEVKAEPAKDGGAADVPDAGKGSGKGKGK